MITIATATDVGIEFVNAVVKLEVGSINFLLISSQISIGAFTVESKVIPGSGVRL